MDADKINPELENAKCVLADDVALPKPPPVLSILLCTVENRAVIFARLHAEVLRQSEGKPVEVLVACDAKQISVGKKRQNLLEQATGEYICFIDDDDWIAPTYVDDILSALKSKPDCVGFKITCTTNGHNEESAITSMRYSNWREDYDGYKHCRSIYHKSPHRRSIALKVGFQDLRYGEDRPYSMEVMKYVKTESFIDKVLYFYRFKTEPFMQKYGILASPRPFRPTPAEPRRMADGNVPHHAEKIMRDANGRPI